MKSSLFVGDQWLWIWWDTFTHEFMSPQTSQMLTIHKHWPPQISMIPQYFQTSFCDSHDLHGWHLWRSHDTTLPLFSQHTSDPPLDPNSSVSVNTNSQFNKLNWFWQGNVGLFFPFAYKHIFNIYIKWNYMYWNLNWKTIHFSFLFAVIG